MADFLLGVLLPVTLAGGLFTLCCFALRPLTGRLKAAVRRAMLAVAMVLFLLPLPLLASVPTALAQSEAAPEDTAAVGDALRQAPPTAGMYQAGRQLALALDESAAEGGGRAQPDAPYTLLSNMAAALTLFWVAGVLVTLSIWLISYLSLIGRLRRNSTTALPLCHVAKLYGAVCKEMDIRHRPRLWLSDSVGAPLLAGVFRPRIILPGDIHSDDALTHAIRHELTHYRKGDLVFKQLGLLVCALHWFNPAAWLLRQAFTTACEQNCDEAVAEGYTMGQRKAYAGTLLQFAGPAPSIAVSAFASQKKQLRERMKRLMKPVNPGRPLRLFGVALPALLVCAALLAGCSLSAGALALEPDSSGIEPVVPSSLVDSSTLDDSSIDSSGLNDDSSIPDVNSDASSDISTSGAGVPEAPENGGNSASTDSGEAAATDGGTGFICPVPDVSHVSRLMTESHRGMDFNAPEGTPIYAAAAGVVATSGWHYSFGNYVVIEHESGLSTLYAHCASLTVAAGETVSQGQQIATVGSTGNSTGSHCHLEISDSSGALLNPLDYIPVPEGIALPE